MILRLSVLRLIVVNFIAASLLLFSRPACGADLNSDVAFRAVQSAFAARDYELVVEILDLPVIQELDRDEEVYCLRALALFHRRKLDACIETCNGIEVGSDDSPWYGFAKLLQAMAYAQRGAREQAEVIYDAEFDRYRSGLDVRDDATALIGFAARLTESTLPGGFTVLPIDFDKAHNLYVDILRLPIKRDQQDEVMYRIARVSQRADRITQCIDEYNSYLSEFGSGRDAISEESGSRHVSKSEKGWSSGRHVIPAQFYLASALYSKGKVSEARMWLQKLLRATPELKPDSQHSRLVAGSRWLLVQTYGMPIPRAYELELAVHEARTFCRSYPTDPRSIQAAWWIAQAYRNQGHLTEAITAYTDFIERTHLGGMAATAKREEIRVSNRLHREWALQARFNLGLLHFRLNGFQQAKEAWLDYIAESPDGPLARACQRRIRDAEFYLVLQAAAEFDEDRVQSLVKAFLLDDSTDRRQQDVLFLPGQLAYQAAMNRERSLSGQNSSEFSDETTGAVKAAFQEAIDAWQPLIESFPDSRQAAVAFYRIGLIQEARFDNPEAALKSYRQSVLIDDGTGARRRAELLTSPLLALSSQHSFGTDQRPLVRLRTRNVQSVTLSTYRVAGSEFRDTALGFSVLERPASRSVPPAETRKISIGKVEKYRLHGRNVEITLPEDFIGVSMVTASGRDRVARTLVIRSDIDVIVRVSGTSALVFVFNTRTGKPVQGAAVHVSNGHEVLFTGVTLEDGTIQQRFEDNIAHQKLHVCAFLDQHVAATEVRLTRNRLPDGRIDSDRALYEPGETVRFRGFIPAPHDAAEGEPRATSCLVSVMDPNGHLIWDEETKLSEFGTFTAELPLARRLTYGTCVFEVRRQANSPPAASGSFTVQQCPRETIRLTLHSQRSVYVPGDSVELSVAARHHWGQPLISARIHCRLPDGRRVTGRTDTTGSLKFQYDTVGHIDGSPLLFTVWIDGQTLQKTHTVFPAASASRVTYRHGQLPDSSPIHPENTCRIEFRADDPVSPVGPRSWIATAGKPVKLSVISRTPDGQPAKKEVRVHIFKREPAGVNPVLRAMPWVPRIVSERTVLDQPVTVDPQTGAGAARFSIRDAGVYTLRLSGENSAGELVSGECRVEVSEPVEVAPLQFLDEIKSQREDNAVHLRLRSDLPTGFALVTLDAGGVIAHRVLRLERGINRIHFDMPLPDAPACRATVTSLQSDGLQTAEKRLAIQPDLMLTTSPEQRFYLPGSDMKVNFQLTDLSGSPVTGEISFNVVREDRSAPSGENWPLVASGGHSASRRHAVSAAGKATPALGSSNTPHRNPAVTVDPLVALAHEMGMPSRRAGDSTRILWPEPAVPSGELTQDRTEAAEAETVDDGQSRIVRFPDAGGTSGDGKTVDQVRRPDVDSSLWMPHILTDEQGLGTVSLTLPQTMNEWRIDARGFDRQTRTALESSTVLTGRNFFVTLRAPNHLQQGDSIRPLARVYNLTGYEGEVHLKLQVLGGGTPRSVISQHIAVVEITQQGETDVQFQSIELQRTGDVKLQLTATAGNTLSDSCLHSLSVKPWGLRYQDRQSGLAAGQATAVVSLPENSLDGSSQLQIHVSSRVSESLISLALGSDLGADSTSAGTRQHPVTYRQFPGSDLLAATAALRFARHRDSPVPEIKRIENRIQNLIRVIVRSQQTDGSWMQGSGGHRSRYEITATVFWALCSARDAGIHVPVGPIRTAQQFLIACLDDSVMHRDTRAMLVHALSVNDAAAVDHVDRLKAEADTLSPLALGYAALTFGRSGREADARDITEAIATQSSMISGDTVQPRPVRGTWFNSATHHRADFLATAALALVRTSQNSEWVQKFRTPLLQHVITRPAPLCPARGVAVMALMEFDERYPTDEQNGQGGTVLINGNPLQNPVLTTERQSESLVVPSSLLVEGDNVIRFQFDESMEYVYSTTLHALTQVPDGQGHRSFPMVASRRYSPLPVEYRGRSIETSRSGNVTAVATGGQLEVHVSFRHHLFRRCYDTDIVIEEHLPAGTAIVNESLSGIACHHEIEDSTLFLYYPAGHPVEDFTYRLRGICSGQYHVLPTAIAEMSTGTRISVGSGFRLSVIPWSEPTGVNHALNDQEKWRLGQLHLNNGNYETAFQLLSQLTWIAAVEDLVNQDSIRNHEIQQAFLKLGQMHADVNQPVEAARFFDRILPGDDGFAEAQMQAGQAFWSAFQVAQPTLNEPRLSEEERDFWLRESKTRLSKAIGVMQHKPAFEMSSSDLSTSLLTLAEVEIKDENYDNAIELLTSTAELNQAELGTGVIEMLKSARAGDIGVSEEDNRRLGSDLGKAYQLLLRANIGTKNLQQAREAIKSLKAVVPDTDIGLALEELERSGIAENQISLEKRADLKVDEVPVDRPDADQGSAKARWVLVALCLFVIGTVGLYFRLGSVKRVTVASSTMPATADVDSGLVRQAYSHLLMRLHVEEKQKEETSESEDSDEKPGSDTAIARRSKVATSEEDSVDDDQELPEATEPGSFIDGYLLTRRISDGRSARVWAVKAPDGTVRAMKLLSLQAHQDANHVAQLKREAEIGKSLDHSAFLTVHGFVHTSTYTYMIMDYFPSMTLRKMLRKRKGLVHYHSADLIRNICLALFHLHRRGWVHLSLKPNNILVDENFDIRIIDLSLGSRSVSGIRAKLRYSFFDWDIGSVFGRKSPIVGTRTYIAPETLRRKQPTPQTDMYSLGIMLFEVLAGVPPFTAKTPEELLNKHLGATPPPAVSLNPKLSSAMDTFLQRLMEKHPRKRYINMGEVISTFAKIKVWKRGI